MLNYKLLTKYGESLNEEQVLKEYPRPLFKRDSYFNLNGLWNYEINKTGLISGSFDRQILVPFPVESALSKVMHILKKDEYLIYKKVFDLPDDFINEKTLLHFGAVDQICDVILNDKAIGHHEGGYLPFSFNVSDCIKEKENVLYVVVKDENSYLYPTGKQRTKRGGIFYTPTSGIWQTVWMESIANESISDIKITPDIDKECVYIHINGEFQNALITLLIDDYVIREVKCAEKDIVLGIEKPHLWSPEDPFLYRIVIQTEKDKIESYFAMRKISIIDNKICLNNKPYFINGVLDQGYYSDGIYTPASYDAYKDDILNMKALGFNALRKHIKIEPMMFYYLCDHLGMLVMQDMVNTGKYKFFKHTALPFIGLKHIKAHDLSKKQRNLYISHVKSALNYLYNVPSIVYYTIFNEGWGEFKPDELYKIVTEIDHTRIIDATSGWFFGKLSDVESYHIYLKPIKLKEKKRPIVISEFGGYCYQDINHSFLVENTNKTAYKMYKSLNEYEQVFINVFANEILPAKEIGLCGLVYTQLSDVEDECNGIYTYDRKICKLNKEKIKSLMEIIKE